MRPTSALVKNSRNQTSLRSFADSKMVRVRQFRRTDRSRPAAKFSFTPEESAVYDDFARMLSGFELEDMLEIISDVLKDAKALAQK